MKVILAGDSFTDCNYGNSSYTWHRRIHKEFNSINLGVISSSNYDIRDSLKQYIEHKDNYLFVVNLTSLVRIPFSRRHINKKRINYDTVTSLNYKVVEDIYSTFIDRVLLWTSFVGYDKYTYVTDLSKKLYSHIDVNIEKNKKVLDNHLTVEGHDIVHNLVIKWLKTHEFS